MCTLTIVPVSDRGIRIACNRDESRLRPPALPPELRPLGPRRVLMPIDPVGGGTWIAATDAPLALVLMNVYTRPIGSVPPAPARTAPAVSRGTIIPHVAQAATLDDALARAGSLDLARYEPFRLVIVDLARRAEIEWSDGELKMAPPAPNDGPWFCTSSGLGDEVVGGPRRRLFTESFAGCGDWPAAQEAFHRHVWPGREFSSVWMTRPEARTVSLTVVELSPALARMRYYPRDDDDASADDPVEVTLSLVAPRAGAAS